MDDWQELRKDRRYTRLIRAAQDADETVEKAKKLARQLREQAEARLRDLIPDTVAVVAEADRAGVTRIIADGLRHFDKVAQPDDAALNHHEAFGRWVTQWLHVGLSLHEPVMATETEYGEHWVRVAFSVREFYSPVDRPSVTSQMVLLPNHDDPRLKKWVAIAAHSSGFRGPLDSWGGGAWVSFVVVGPVHRSYIKAASNARATTVESDNWGKIITPKGWL